VRHT